MLDGEILHNHNQLGTLIGARPAAAPGTSVKKISHMSDEALSHMDISCALSSAPALLQHPATHAEASIALLDRLPCEEFAVARRILQLLVQYGVRSAQRSKHLLQLVELVPASTAREILSFLPQLIGDSDADMSDLVSTVNDVVAADRTLTLPAVGALGEVALPEALKPGLARLALHALPLTAETDLPTLVRSLMNTLGPSSTAGVLRALREQLGAVSAGTLALLLQVVSNTLRVNGAAARALIRLCAAAPELSSWDCLLLLLLLEVRQPLAVTRRLHGSAWPPQGLHVGKHSEAHARAAATSASGPSECPPVAG